MPTPTGGAWVSEGMRHWAQRGVETGTASGILTFGAARLSSHAAMSCTSPLVGSGAGSRAGARPESEIENSDMEGPALQGPGNGAVSEQERDQRATSKNSTCKQQEKKAGNPAITIWPEGVIRRNADGNPKDPSSVDGPCAGEKIAAPGQATPSRKVPPRLEGQQVGISRGPQGLASLQALTKSGLKGEPGGRKHETRHGAASRARAAPLVLPKAACMPTLTGSEWVSEGMRLCTQRCQNSGAASQAGARPESEIERVDMVVWRKKDFISVWSSKNDTKGRRGVGTKYEGRDTSCAHAARHECASQARQARSRA
ncbi:hypothetical protein B0H13DRAFT_1857454 [Mycena leptocephala]|nr:hypothetical protein B0H13DRAFT_1857454 [Mycena leptocephala]